MAYIGKEPSFGAFEKDIFTGDGSTTQFTLTHNVASATSMIVSLGGVIQEPGSAYDIAMVSGSQKIVFASAPANSVRCFVVYLGRQQLVASRTATDTTPTIDTFTGNGSTAAYTLSVAPPNENYLAVFWDGVYQHHSEYSVSGTTLTFTTNVPSSTAVEVYIPSVNGIGTPSDATVTPAKLSTGGPSWDTNSNQIIGSHYVRSDSTSMSTTSATTVATHAIATFRSVNYKVQITQGTNYHTSEINVIHDGSTVDITEY